MKSHRELLDELNDVLKVNFKKAVIAFLVMLIISSASLTIVAVPSALTGSAAVLFVSMLVLLVFIFVLMYGFLVMLFRFQMNERVVLGHLFDGFRDLSRVIPASMLFTLSLALSMVAVIIPTVIATYIIPKAMASLGFVGLFILLAVLYTIVIAITVYRYSFIWYCLYTDRSLKPFAALRKSAKIVRGHKWNYFLFSLKAGGIFLAVAAVSYVFILGLQIYSGTFDALLGIAESLDSANPNLMSALSSTVKLPPFLDLLSSIAEIAYLVCGYIAIIRILMGSAVYFCNLTGIRVSQDSTETPVGDTLENSATSVINLPSPDDASETTDATDDSKN